jgi:hypothetical protein
MCVSSEFADVFATGEGIVLEGCFIIFEPGVVSLHFADDVLLFTNIFVNCLYRPSVCMDSAADWRQSDRQQQIRPGERFKHATACITWMSWAPDP